MAAGFSGKLLLEGSSPAGGLSSAVLWSDAPLNWFLVSASVITLVLYLRRLRGILPFLAGGLLRGKELINLEDSVGLSRDRSILALACFVPFCLLVSGSGMLLPGPVLALSPGNRTLAVIGALAALLIVRAILVFALYHPAAGSRENYMTASRVLYDMGILWTLTMAAAAGLCRILGANSLTFRTVLLYISGFFFFLICLRRTQILSNACNKFTAILYLCALEIIPAAAAIAPAVLL